MSKKLYNPAAISVTKPVRYLAVIDEINLYARVFEYTITKMLLIKLFRIGPVTGPRLAVLDRGRRPRSNTADLGPVTPVTGLIRNNLINEIFIN